MDDDDFAELFKRLNRPNGETTWRDVAFEFQTLGKTLSDAARAAWQRQESNPGLRELQDALQAIVEQFSHVVGASPTETQQTREQLNSLIDSIRQALDSSTRELRPDLVTLLRQANAQLRKMTSSGE